MSWRIPPVTARLLLPVADRLNVQSEDIGSTTPVTLTGSRQSGPALAEQ
jgi:hypothetical protein